MSQIDAIKATFLILIHAIYVLYTYYTMHFNIITEDSEYFFCKSAKQSERSLVLAARRVPMQCLTKSGTSYTKEILKTPTALKAQNILQPLK